MSHTVSTKMQPNVLVTISDAEFERWVDLGILYDGVPIPEGASTLDGQIAQLVDNQSSATRAEIRTLMGADAGGLNDGIVSALVEDDDSLTAERLRAASVAAVESEATVAPVGTWDFAQAPTVAGVPVGPGGGGAADNATKSNLRNVLCLGDSITAGDQDGSGYSYPLFLGQAEGGGVAILNAGYGGWTSTDVAIKAGAINPTLGAFTIPAGTSPVAVTVTSPMGAWRPNGTPVTFTWTGTIAGVAGALTHNVSTDGSWSFTRSQGGSTVAVPAGSTFHCTEYDTHRADLAIIMVGRNDVDQAVVLRDVAAMVANLSPTVKRYLVLSITTSSSETSGTAGHDAVVSINNALAATYGNSYVDVRRYLIDNGLSFNGLTPTAGDTTAIANDTIPPSLLVADGVHPNKYGYRALAQAVADRLYLLGWAPDQRTPIGSISNPNLFADASFENGAATMTSYLAPAPVRSTSAAHTGSYGMRSTITSAVTAPQFYATVTADPSTPHSGSIWVRPSRTIFMKPILQAWDASGANLAGDYSSPGQTVTANTWTKLAINSTFTNAGAKVTLAVDTDGAVTWTAGDTVDFDDVAIVAGTTAP